MVSLPLWAVFAVGFGSPVLSFLGVVFAQWLGRKAARELESRSRREETMRTMRWAAELAVSEDDARAQLGIAQLDALGVSDMLDGDLQPFIDAALECAVEEVVGEVEASGPDAVTYLEAGQTSRAAEPGSDVPFRQGNGSRGVEDDDD